MDHARQDDKSDQRPAEHPPDANMLVIGDKLAIGFVWSERDSNFYREGVSFRPGHHCRLSPHPDP